VIPAMDQFLKLLSDFERVKSALATQSAHFLCMFNDEDNRQSKL